MLGTGLDLQRGCLSGRPSRFPDFSSSALLDAISPGTRSSAAELGGYGHPHQELDALSARNIEVYRTDLLGTIVAATDGNSISFSTAFGSGSSVLPLKTQSSSSSTAVISDDGPKYSQDNSASSSGITVHITKTGEKYHSAGCQYLKKSDIEVTPLEAKSRGLTPCSRCNPPYDERSISMKGTVDDRRKLCCL